MRGLTPSHACSLEGSDPEGLFPSILGHEAGAVVESVGEGVTSVKPGDKVVPCYTPQCGEPDCIFCHPPRGKRTNLCPAIRATQGQGVMPDGTTRFTAAGGEDLYHFMGCSTFAEYTVVAEISCAKVSDTAPLDTCSLLGCGVATGLGAVWNTCDVEGGSSVAVFGLGAVGLSVIQGARMRGAKRIFAIDTNPGKFEAAQSMGATDCLNPADHDAPIQEVVVGMTKWGVDYTFGADAPYALRRSPCSHPIPRLYGQHQGDARRARMRASRLGRVLRRRSGRGGRGNQHAPLPARHRPQVDWHRLWRLQVPLRGPDTRRRLRGWQA